MDRMCMMIIWLSITYAMEDSKRVEDVVSITGCNTTLEWLIASTYKEAFVRSITVTNANGRKIAEKKEMACQNGPDSSMYCEVRNTSNKEWKFVVVLFNVTQASGGNYTGHIKYGPRKENSTIQLKVIAKPTIKEVQTSILHEPLRINCRVESELKNLSYYWKLNGTYINSTDCMDITSSNLTYGNLTMADKWNIFSCSACSDSNCCIESETFVPDPYYGPESVTLSVNDSDIYLNENERFKMNCSAKCNPLCSFVWIGYVSSRNEDLVINNFDSRMGGNYSCIATNNKTGVTAKSKQISLHYVKDSSATSLSQRDTGDSHLKLLGLGLFIAAFSLVTVVVLLLCKNRRRLGSQTMNERCALSSNRALNQDIHFNIRERPLPIPATQERTCRIMVGPLNPRINRKSRSCGAFFDENHDSWNPVRQTLSLQTLIQLSHEIGRRGESDESIIEPYFHKMVSRCSISGPVNGIMLEEMYSKVRKNNQISDIQQNPGEILQEVNNFQDDQYSTVDETSCSVYDYARENTREVNLQTIHKNAEAGYCDSDYDYAIL
ncbi:hypothetical protein ACJMK2_026040 [Sinanodonta woodiana]|uniref:Ig-like domain-containing protein n=1 Tax=Sinanodonta woodiana TaxID=1069815 RepID=A0ABD3XIB9_SINWO